MPHTAEELWELLPASDQKLPSVHLATWPEPSRSERSNAEGSIPWQELLEVRTLVLRATEQLRKSKRIGSNQEGAVEILTDSTDLAKRLEQYLELLTTISIVSEIQVKRVESLAGSSESEELARVEDQERHLVILARKSTHPKCERCWNLRPTVGQSANHPGLCERCAKVIAEAESAGVSS